MCSLFTGAGQIALSEVKKGKSDAVLSHCLMRGRRICRQIDLQGCELIDSSGSQPLALLGTTIKPRRGTELCFCLLCQSTQL